MHHCVDSLARWTNKHLDGGAYSRQAQLIRTSSLSVNVAHENLSEGRPGCNGLAVGHYGATATGEILSFDLDAAWTTEGIDQYPMLELLAGLAGGVEVSRKVSVLFIGNPPANAAAIGPAFYWQPRIRVLQLI